MCIFQHFGPSSDSDIRHAQRCQPASVPLQLELPMDWRGSKRTRPGSITFIKAIEKSSFDKSLWKEKKEKIKDLSLRL